jgi:transposase
LRIETPCKATPKAERDDWIAQYFAVLVSGFGMHLAQAPPISSTMPKKVGRKKQDASESLLDALLQRAEHILHFLDDLSVPFTNSQAERDLERCSNICPIMKEKCL